MADYITFFGFSEDPFKISPNPKFFFPAESHAEALAALHYGVSERKGFILLLGEKGVGKTTLINSLISILDANVKIAYIPRSNIPFKKILKDIMHQLHVPLKLSVKGSMLHELYYYLIRSLEQDQKVVIILDEAHHIDLSVVEEVRLLANLETSTSKLLQIVLCGKPELREKLRTGAIRQIGQRISITAQLDPLTEKETLAYIDHRLKIVGSASSKVFTDDALKMICKRGGGYPRAINILCSNALSVGCGRTEEKISAATVREIYKQKALLNEEALQKVISRPRRRRSLKVFIFFAIAAIFSMAALLNKDKDVIQSVLNHYIPSQTAKQSFSEKKVMEQASEIAMEEKKPDILSLPAKQQPIQLLPVIQAMQNDKKIRIKAVAKTSAGIDLCSLARQYYHAANATLIDYILQLNTSITNPNMIDVNQEIRIPEITDALLIKSSPNGEMTVHLATFIDQASAEQYSRKIVMKGKNIRIIPRKVSAQEMWYRVVAGPYVNWNDASGAILNLQRRGILWTIPD